jgi:hypothetical protein
MGVDGPNEISFDPHAVARFVKENDEQYAKKQHEPERYQWELLETSPDRIVARVIYPALPDHSQDLEVILVRSPNFEREARLAGWHADGVQLDDNFLEGRLGLVPIETLRSVRAQIAEKIDAVTGRCKPFRVYGLITASKPGVIMLDGFATPDSGVLSLPGTHVDSSTAIMISEPLTDDLEAKWEAGKYAPGFVAGNSYDSATVGGGPRYFFSDWLNNGEQLATFGKFPEFMSDKLRTHLKLLRDIDAEIVKRSPEKTEAQVTQHEPPRSPDERRSGGAAQPPPPASVSGEPLHPREAVQSSAADQPQADKPTFITPTHPKPISDQTKRALEKLKAKQEKDLNPH